jgi:hypothetical protein
VNRSSLLTVLLALSATSILPACAVSEKDASAREWQHRQCMQVLDEKDRERCLKRVDSEYGRAR